MEYNTKWSKVLRNGVKVKVEEEKKRKEEVEEGGGRGGESGP